MVIPTFMRRTYLVLPKPVKRMVRFARPKLGLRSKSDSEGFVDQMNNIADAVFAPVWKWRG